MAGNNQISTFFKNFIQPYLYTIMKIYLVLLVLAISGFKVSKEYPSAEISNGLIKAKFYLPEAETGYYQGTRFDRAGIISSLEYNGHSFFGEWNPKAVPGLHDAITGPVDEFMVIGYDEAPLGGNFLKIGVGELIKPEEKAYSRFKTYEIKNHGKRKVNVKKNSIHFSQVLKTQSGFSYKYEKKTTLVPGEPTLLLEQTLKNTGPKTIETYVYNHNFFMIDNEPTNENIRTTFVFDFKAEGNGFGTIAEIENKSIVYKRALKPSENVFCNDVQGFGNTSKDFDIHIENLKTGAGVHITGDKPINNMIYWACATTACPEPYIKIKVEPGQTFAWTTKYKFKG